MAASSPKATSADETWMRVALHEAREGEGTTHPNPPVGAVLVRKGRIVGRGFHAVAGGPHAEIVAIRNAGKLAKGCTLYVTLEPCCTQGRTPPCTDAIRKAGIRRVVFAVKDPNPAHDGKAIKYFRRLGIGVTTNICAEEASMILAPFAKWTLTRRPFVTLKLAMSLDGRIADSRGDSKWISSPLSRAHVQAARKKADAILVGVGTVRRDDPSLLVNDGTRTPLRIVVDSRGRTSLQAKLLADEHASRTVIATTRACPTRRVALFRGAGAQVLVCAQKNGRVSLPSLLKQLGAMGMLHVFCEGGGELAASLIQEQAVDRLMLFYCPLLFGGDASASFAGRHWVLGRSPRFDIESLERVGPDMLVYATPGK